MRHPSIGLLGVGMILGAAMAFTGAVLLALFAGLAIALVAAFTGT